MKKNLFRKFLALFLTGTMLAGVGCKDYDDDIKKTNDRIDQLESGKIASVEEQIAAIKSSMTSLETAYKAADAELKAGLEKQASDMAAIKSSLEASIKSLKDAHNADIKKIAGDVAALGTKLEGYNTALKASIAAVAKDLADNYYPKAAVEQKLAALDEEFAGEIVRVDARIDACDEAIKAIDEQLVKMQEQIDEQLAKMQGQIDGKVSKEDYEAFTLATNKAIQENADAIATLSALCAGFEDGQTIKGYIDAATKDLTEMLGKCVLTETYEAFLEKYEEYKLEVEASIDSKTTLEEVKAQFAASVAEFNAGVTEVIVEALKDGVDGAEGGVISEYLKAKLSALEKKLQDQIDVLKKDVEALAGQIQSLVYIPEFSDGTTDMKTYSFAGNEAGNSVVLKFRVSPAAMADKMAALYEAGALSLVAEEVKTRATEAPAATITAVEVADAAAGTFTVSAQIANYPAAGKAVALALAVQAPVQEGSTVANDVVSNFAGVQKPAAATPLQFALIDAEGEEYANEDIEVIWNTKKDASKREILKDLELKVSLDAGESFITLAEASEIIGATVAAEKYSVTGTASASNTNYTVANVADKAWGSAYASAQFKADGTSALVGSSVSFAYSIKAKLAANAAAEALTGTVVYKAVNVKGGEMSFAKQALPWTYDFVKAGMAAGDATPAIGVDVFGEIQITGVPAGMKLSEIMAGSSNIEITATPATATKGTATFTHVASVVGQGVKIALSDYSWGASYAIKATYTVNQTDYVIAGTIETAAAPTEVKYDFAPVTIGYEDKAITGNWGAIYTAWKGDFAGFKDAAEFTAAIFDKSVVAVTDTKLINTANPTPGQDVAASNGTKMVATAVALTGDLKKADITADEDKFVQTAAWETWYGQKVTVTMTYDVALPEYVLTPNDAWVNADGVVGTKGEVDATTEKWSVKLQGAVKDYFYFAPASNLIAKTYVKKSVDGTPVNSVYAKVSGAADSPQVSWENGTTTMKDVVMTAKLVLDSKVDVATKDFTIRADDPIATFTQAAAQDAKYVPNGKLEVNLLKGISLKDINGKEWIKADGVGETTTTNNYLANTVFGMTTGNDATIGIAFGKPTNDANLSLELVDNKLSYSNDGSVLLKDVTVTIPAKITYWLGEKTVDVKVIIKK